MKEVETQHIWVNLPWSVLTFANFVKYPNQHAEHVVSVDVISRTVTKEGLLITERLLQLKQPIPSIFKRIGLPISETSFFLEKSVIDLKNRSYEATSKNLSMRSLFRADEICQFLPCPDGTIFQQRAQFSCSSYFNRIIEDFAISRFQSNAAKGRDGLQSVLLKLENEVEWVANEVKCFGLNQLKSAKAKLDDVEKLPLQVRDFATKNSDIRPIMSEACDGDWTSPVHHNPFC